MLSRSIPCTRSTRPSLREKKAISHWSGKVLPSLPLARLTCGRLIRQCKASDDTDKIRHIIEQLCQEFAFGPSRQNASALGGLIGLAAVAIALSNVLTFHSGTQCFRMLQIIWTILFLLFLDVFQIRIRDYGIMHWSRCIILQKWQRGRYCCTSTTFLTRCVRYKIICHCVDE